MRICPRCGRDNKPRARFCDRCGFAFAGHAGSQPPTERNIPRPAPIPLDSNPIVDATTPSGGVPTEAVGRRYSPTLKLGAPPDSPPPATDNETVKAPAAPDPSPPPDETISGAVFQRQRDTGEGAGADHVGWFVVEGGVEGPPTALWPLRAGVTLVGRDSQAISGGMLIDREDVAPIHAFLFHRAGRTWFTDLDSPAGSWVNAQRLPPFAGRELQDRDVVRLGALVVRYRALTDAVS